MTTPPVSYPEILLDAAYCAGAAALANGALQLLNADTEVDCRAQLAAYLAGAEAFIHKFPRNHNQP